VANGIGNAVGVQHTETSLIVWAGSTPGEEVIDKSGEAQQSQEPISPVFDADRMYDAGDQGCAAGPMDDIAAIIREMSVGQTLEIHATDPVVPVDLDAWCRMTGNELVDQQEHHYLIRKN
jgi:tRNA 2-thiouridine synthesizing protein A